MDSWTSEAGTTQNYVYQIRWYDKEDGIFPKILKYLIILWTRKFPGTNFKVDLRKLYNHIDTDEPLHIYDSSSGWGVNYRMMVS